jgi:hypothetical protein
LDLAAGATHENTTKEACVCAPNTASQTKIVVTVMRKLNWLNLLVLDCFWRVSNSMIFTCHRLKGKKKKVTVKLHSYFSSLYVHSGYLYLGSFHWDLVQDIDLAGWLLHSAVTFDRLQAKQDGFLMSRWMDLGVKCWNWTIL